MMNNVNVFNASMKLNVFCENDYVLIVIKDHNNFKIRIIRSQKLIKKIL